jgi:hypothetical protein
MQNGLELFENYLLVESALLPQSGDILHSAFVILNLVQRTIGFPVQAPDFSGAGEGDEFDSFFVSGFEADCGAGGDVQSKSAGRRPIEAQGFVDFIEMKVRPHLNRPIARI